MFPLFHVSSSSEQQRQEQPFLRAFHILVSDKEKETDELETESERTMNMLCINEDKRSRRSG